MQQVYSYKLKTALVLVLAAIVLGSCTTKNSSNKRIITVTIEPLRYFTEQIVGNKFTVRTMVPAGNNPETFEPTARQMQEFSQSDLYIKVGAIGFEQTRLKQMAANAPHTIMVDTSEGISLLATDHGHHDPHTWMSCKNARIIAQNIYKAVVQVDARDSSFYRKNLNTLLQTIAKTHSAVQAQMRKKQVKAFVVYHPSLTYFAEENGLEQISLEEDGREPSARQLAKAIESARKQQARTLFIQKEFANRNTDVVSENSGIKGVEINPLNYNWPHEMLQTAIKLQ